MSEEDATMRGPRRIARDEDSLWHIVFTVVERMVENNRLGKEACATYSQTELEGMATTEFTRINDLMYRRLERSPFWSAFDQGSHYLETTINNQRVNVLRSWLDGRFSEAAVAVLSKLLSADEGVAEAVERARAEFFSFITWD